MENQITSNNIGSERRGCNRVLKESSLLEAPLRSYKCGKEPWSFAKPLKHAINPSRNAGRTFFQTLSQSRPCGRKQSLIQRQSSPLHPNGKSLKALLQFQRKENCSALLKWSFQLQSAANRNTFIQQQTDLTVFVCRTDPVEVMGERRMMMRRYPHPWRQTHMHTHRQRWRAPLGIDSYRA